LSCLEVLFEGGVEGIEERDVLEELGEGEGFDGGGGVGVGALGVRNPIGTIVFVVAVAAGAKL